MALSGGDVLAAGGKSAQFGRADITQFENDFIYDTPQEIMEKYGISEAEYDQYSALRMALKHLPDLRPLGEEREEVNVGFSISDHRKNYLDEALSPAAVVKEEVKKFPDPTFGTFSPILDRLLIMRIADDPDTELLEDGSTRNKKTGLITAAKYRQHSNVGIVLGTGRYVVLSGVRFEMSEFVKPGCKVTYGDYNSEVFPMDEKKAIALCDSIGINYVKDEQGLRVVRVQDVRGVEWPSEKP